jgi:hypothetical protein
MDVPIADAIQALNLAVAGLLPPPASPQLAPDVLINPVKSHLSGIGGYVGLHPEPNGQIHARKLRAQIVIRVKANSIGDLGAAESTVTNALLGANQNNLRSQGIYRISRDTVFGTTYEQDDGLAVPAGRDIRFDVDFEYRQLPDAPEGSIDILALDLMLRTTDGKATLLYGGDFASDPLAAFASVDDSPVSNGPSVWAFNAALGRVEQTSSISGGSNPFNASKRGACLVLRNALVERPPADLVLHAELGADSGGIGLVFNFVDADNFYFFLMSQPTPYRFLGKKIAGDFAFLDSGGQDNGNAYDPGEHRIRLIQQGGEISLSLDGTTILTARENAPPPVGSVGFLARSCPTARFQSLRWIGL